MNRLHTIFPQNYDAGDDVASAMAIVPETSEIHQGLLNVPFWWLMMVNDG